MPNVKHVDFAEYVARRPGRTDGPRIMEAVRPARAWFRLPQNIRAIRFKDMEVHFQVHEAWHKNHILKNMDLILMEDFATMVGLCQASPILRKENARSMEQAAEFMAAWNKTALFKKNTPEGLVDAALIVDAWERNATLKGKKPKDLDAAMKVVANAKRSPSFAKASGKTLEDAAKLVEAQKKTPLLRGKSINQLEDAFALSSLWQRSPLSKKYTPQKAVEMYDACTEWKKKLGSRKITLLKEVECAIGACNTDTVLKKHTTINILKSVKIVDKWNVFLKGKKPLDLEKAFKFINDLVAAPKSKNTPYASLLFDGEKLFWLQSNNNREWPAYSGRDEMWKNKRFSVEDQKKVGLGPLPEGCYSVPRLEYQTLQTDSLPYALWQWGGQGKFAGGQKSWGRERVWVHPEPGTESYGRKYFSIHGGYEPGSAGCIDLVGKIEEFMELFLEYGKDMRLEVRYHTVR